MSRQDVETQFAEEYAAWDADPFTFAPRAASRCRGAARALP